MLNAGRSSRRVRVLCAGFAASTTLVLLAPSGVLPAGADPTASITPGRGLVDRQVVTVKAAGLPPNTNIEVLECGGTVDAPPNDALSCDGYSEDATGYSDIRGNFIDTPGDRSGTYGYRVLILPSALEHGAIVSCDARHPCVLYVGVNINDFKQPHTFVPLDYASTAVGSIPGPQTKAAAFRKAASGTSGTSGVWIAAIVMAAVLAVVGLALFRRRIGPGGGVRQQQMYRR